MKPRTVCKHGHPWTPENVYIKADGKRRCHTCLSSKRPQRLHCKRGHPWTPENTFTKSDGRRQCHACRAIPAARRAERAHCKRGHAFPENARTRGDGKRRCQTCRIQARKLERLQQRNTDTPLTILTRIVKLTSFDDGPDHECWVWLGAVDRDGYGRIHGYGRTRQLARLMYEALIGPVPADIQCDHLCSHSTCWNPAHIELVPADVNQARAAAIRGDYRLALAPDLVRQAKRARLLEQHAADPERAKRLAAEILTRFDSTQRENLT